MNIQNDEDIENSLLQNLKNRFNRCAIYVSFKDINLMCNDHIFKLFCFRFLRHSQESY